MNGIGLLILISLGGQLLGSQGSGPQLPNLPQSGSPFPGQQGGSTIPTLPFDRNDYAGGEYSENTKDFGWQIHPKDKVLEYIVQLSPSDILAIEDSKSQSGLDALEKSSLIPPELMGRAKRVVVRIGTDDLPRIPSLAEIERTIPRVNNDNDIAAAIGSGRFSDVESDKIVQAQSNGGFPSFPAPQGRSTQESLSDLSDNVIDRAASAAGRSAVDSATGLAGAASDLGSRFLNEAGNAVDAAANAARDRFSATSPNVPTRSAPPPLGSQDLAARNDSSSRVPSRFQDTAPNTGAPLPSTGNPSQTPMTAPLDRNSIDRTATNWQPGTLSNTNPNAPTYDNFGNSVPSLDPRSNTQGGFGRAPGQGLANDIFQQNPNLGTAANGNSPFNGYNAAQNPNSQYAGQPSDPRFGSQIGFAGQPGLGNQGGFANNDPRAVGNNGALSNIPDGRLASAAGQIPRGNEGNGNGNTSNGGNQSSPSDLAGSAPVETATQQRDSFLQVFFILSLVVNFYLTTLLRKLLGRYRALLTSVRGQTA